VNTSPYNPSIFLIIGAQKAGTTALHSYLIKHPHIKGARIKEIHYFNSAKRYSRGATFYHDHFKFESNNKFLYLDASPSYLASPMAYHRIYAYNPKIKMIVLIRNPIERAYSAWNMYFRLYKENPNWFYDSWLPLVGLDSKLFIQRSFEEINNFGLFVEREIDHYKKNSGQMIEAPILPQGMYSMYLKKFYQLFPKNQIFIVESRSLKCETVSNLKRIEGFLGLNSYDWNKENLPAIFKGEYSEETPREAFEMLNDFYASHNKELYELMGRSLLW